MREIISFIREFIKKDYNKYVYLYFLLFVSVSVCVNYLIDFGERDGSQTFDDAVLDRRFGKPIGFLYYTLFFAFAYYLVAIPNLFFVKKVHILFDYKFWLKSSLFLMLLGFGTAFYQYREVLSDVLNSQELYFLRKVLANAKRGVIYLIPFFVIKCIFDKNIKSFYGLTFKGLNIKPFLGMLLFMLPLIVIASYQSGFQHTYPVFKPWMHVDIFNLSQFQISAIYELFYGLDFVFVELMFRGALVIGMIAILGKDSILPMVSVYVFLHFGKPMGETISSMFGGYILGIIAYQTRSIMGGVIVHVGIAYFMEIAALAQYYFNKEIN